MPGEGEIFNPLHLSSSRMSLSVFVIFFVP